jgi:alpha-amylase
MTNVAARPGRGWCRSVLLMLVVASATLAAPVPLHAQAGFDDDRVILQGFYWESYRHGHPDKFPAYGAKRWYGIVREQAAAIREGRFDLVWLPPPCYAGEHSAGYGPREYFRLDNSYGTEAEHRGLLKDLLAAGVEPVADVVVNHRDGTGGWATFKNPDWDTKAITRDDEAFTDSRSEARGKPEAERGAPEERPDYAGHGGTTYAYNVFRDLDHTNPQVRKDIVKYLKLLQSAGYRGWRYDMVHGYHARHLAEYNRETKPTFSVGEYEWDAHAAQRGWIWNTSVAALANANLGGEGRLQSASSVFDFTTFFTLKDNKGKYANWYAAGNGLGMIGDTTDGLPWKQRAVTFVENHDTGYRTNEDGNPEEGHRSDSFANTWEVEQAYAYVLTHPGVPSVYWKHYFDWGEDLRNKIRALVNARKVAGVHAGSTVHTQQNAKARGVYAAMVTGREDAGGGPRELYVRVGGTDADWEPKASGYDGYREYARGAGWKVWVKHPNADQFRNHPLKEAITDALPPPP